MKLSKVFDTILDHPLYIIGIVSFFLVVYLLSTGKTLEQLQREHWRRKAERYKKLAEQEGFGRGGGGEAVGGRTGGPAYDELGFQDLNEADLIYEKKKESFRGGVGGGGEGIGARTGGSGVAYQEIGFADLKKKESFRGGVGGGGEGIGARTGGSGVAYQEDDFTNMTDKDKDQLKEAFQGIGPAGEVTGTPETTDVSGPADASLKQPREPYNLLKNLPPAPRGSISCLNAACCAETDFEWRTNQTGNYLQRTNNYKREFPDSCSAPLTELNLAFYKNSFLPKA